uniref:Macaca fascicularis brain cDNA clone: QmoA-11770, similar to human isopentenyl-diphosphate delta isomerase (IDI1), mRNA, RefSeq: NM_004508.2 n=1 Tax=Macaca fascicularis TaxID=9541 RepID=I7GJ54_MACFA|nr:unnamed protein product [Macaca fascicularis]
MRYSRSPLDRWDFLFIISGTPLLHPSSLGAFSALSMYLHIF